MKFLKNLNPFRELDAQEMRRRLIADADRLAIQHAANAEHQVALAESSSALAEMYAQRANRLRGELLSAEGATA